MNVCLLNDDRSALQASVRFLSSLGCRVRPFTDPNTLLEYARNRRPETAIVSFGQSRADGLEIRARLREVSPLTSVFIPVKLHGGEVKRNDATARKELLHLIKHNADGHRDWEGQFVNESGNHFLE
jgi:PleD family two-component response regulator